MNCDPLARWYRWLEYAGMGRALEWRRLAFLPELVGARRVLILGEGDGRFLAALLAANPHAQVDCVDLSARMLALAQRRAGEGRERVQFYRADAREWALPAGVRYDAVVTHFFLDCFTTGELARLFERLAPVLAARTCWVVSEFHQPERGFAAWRARLWIGGLYVFFGVATGLRVRRLPRYAGLLEAHGFRRKRAITTEMGLLISEWWERS